jgi:hypothetical protein
MGAKKLTVCVPVGGGAYNREVLAIMDAESGVYMGALVTEGLAGEYYQFASQEELMKWLRGRADFDYLACEG